MAFKGTATRSAARIAEEIENVGGHINAYTAREQTAYYVKLLKEDLPLGVDIIGDILTHSTFLPEKSSETAFTGQPMGMPTLGPEGLIREMSRETLMSYMQTHYTTQNIVVAAAGNLHHDDVVERVSRHFADLPTGAVPDRMPGRYTGGEFRLAKELDQAHILLGFPSVRYGGPDYHAALLLSTLLGGGMSSRLFQEIREKRGLVYSVYSFTTPFLDGGLFGIYAGTGGEEARELIPVTLAELQKVQQSVGMDELSRARAQLKSSLLMSLESTGSRCEQIARQLQIFGRLIPIAET
uniref:Uncharacterized zinc protease RF_0338-like n=1 Tax=Drosophila rhopaloa TaxID=1041015 RepID=A0A6P4FNC8_DRORH